MARTFFGGSPADVLAQPTPSATDDPTALGFVTSGSLTVWSASTGGTQLTDLQTAGGAATSTVTPDSLGRIMFYGPDPYTAAVWVQDANGNRWRIDPSDLASRTGNVSSVNGKTGAVTIAGSDLVLNAADVDDSSAVGRSVLTAADAAAARAAIGAAGSTSDVAAIVDAKGDLIVGIGNDTVARQAAAANGLVPAYDSTKTTGIGTFDPSTKADKTGGLDQFARVIGTPADGDVLVWDADLNAAVWTDLSTRFAAADPGTGRILPAALPKYYHDTPIVNTGAAVPTDAYQPIVFERPAAASLVPIILDHDKVQGASALALQPTSDLAVGDWIGFVIAPSGDAATPALGSVSVAFTTGAATVTWNPLNFPNATAAIVSGVAKVTTLVPSGTNVTFTARDTNGTALNRVHLLGSMFRLPNIAAATPIDVVQPGSGNNTTSMTTITTSAPTSNTVQANEIAIGAAMWNSLAAPASRTVAPTGVWAGNELSNEKSDNGTSARSLGVWYTVLSAAGKPVLTTQMTASDSASGQWAAQLFTAKAA